MNKKILALIVSVLVVIALVVGVTACSEAISNNPTDSGNNVEEQVDQSELLGIIRSDLKLTQEQVMSQIKAEYLKTNNGYQAEDEIVLIVNLSEESLLELYNNGAHERYKTVQEYIKSEEGEDAKEKIEREQNSVLAYLEQRDMVKDVVCSYSAVTNGIAIKTAYKNLEEIESLSCVTSAIMSETYNRPEIKSTSNGDASAIRNIVDIYETGIFDSSSVDYDGSGTVVAILDNGFDLSHTVFQNDPPKTVYALKDIAKFLANPDFLASQLTKGLDVSDVYYSKKIPFKYDYADKDSDVNPTSEEHGTHVAGIIGGKDDVITGVAINTQLVLMKVFPDADDGGKTEDIIMALNDAVIMGVDCINMSLGSSCGFTREKDEEDVNKIYDRIGEAGISLITAASNSYSSAFGGDQGNTNMVTNPDSGTVGSPSTYESALSVASISGTMSRYMVANDSQTFFFKESNAITGKENDFYKELYTSLNLDQTKDYTFEYVTIPGVGMKVNFKDLDLTGKIALVKRGDNTFEEKAMLAKNAGAIACIIYNNIDGDILMSMGKTDHIPTISISKSDGAEMSKHTTGTITVSMNYQAGPFMSDFSSWGPTPSLELKPEITGHGGNIKSSVHGGGYDELSGTSMATPNVTGLVVLIRQYLKEKYPEYSAKQISNLTNSLLMSTASIILNEEGNPYSPRKQGAGLASLKSTVTTKAYLSVDGKDRPKLELGDDPQKTGVYTMKFNIVNISDKALRYSIDMIGMTESVSSSDEDHVAETPFILGSNYTVSVNGSTVSADSIVVPASGTLAVTLTYTLTDDDKAYIENLFPYGMYVEGFVKVNALDEGEVNLNMPFLAFYGDWTQAPMFDKTYYEVETTKHDGAIDEEDKIKADYYATTPYGSYFYNYIIPLGTYLYDMEGTDYDPIPAVEEHIAISDSLGCIDGISAIYAGMLRCAQSVTFTIIDKLTGEEVYTTVDYNGRKAFSNGGSPVPYYNNLKLKSSELGLINNRMYEFKMVALCDYGDGGKTTNVRNTFSFDFAFDNEAPILKEVKYEKVYDKSLKKDRYYMYLTIYDNQYVMSVSPILFTSSSSYTTLTDSPIPVYSEKGTNNVLKIEITDYLEDIYQDALITSALAFSIDDYALNSNIYICQLPGTKGDFKFTQTGELDGSDYIILSMYEDEIVDLTEYLATADSTVDEDKSYLKHLVWTSSNEKVVEVQDGILLGIKEGRATVTVMEQMNLKQAVIIINVKKRTENSKENLRTTPKRKADYDNLDESALKNLRFSSFETLFAYSRAAQTSEIGQTGSTMFISSTGSRISFYPGEKIQLKYDVEPWYVARKYDFTFESSNPQIATVDQDGVVTALKEGSVTITLKTDKSTIRASLRISVKSPFVIENRMLVAYKGLGGEVVIPDDEGILYIGSYAFCLYDTDNSIELTEDDYDANKIPSANTSITSVIIPDGVERIEKYAFYNCTSLRKVVLGKDCKQIFHYAFYGDEKLEEINLDNIDFIGNYAFYGCKSLDNINTPKLFALGAKAFVDCTSLTAIDLRALRNTGDTAFRGCTSLSDVQLSKDTKLSEAMFVRTALTEVRILNDNVFIPAYCFAQCDSLTTVIIENNIYDIKEGAFCQCPNLQSVVFNGKVDNISNQAFYDDDSLTTFTLPDCEVSIGELVFYQADNLSKLVFGKNTVITDIKSSNLKDTSITTFEVDPENTNYSVSTDGKLLLNGDGTTIILVAIKALPENYVLDENVTNVSSGAFSGADIVSLTINNPETIIGDYAFSNCNNLVEINLPSVTGVKVGQFAFAKTTALLTVNNLDKVTELGDYAFSETNARNLVLGSVSLGEGAFYGSKLEEVTLGENTVIGFGAFQNCVYLKTVNMPSEGGVVIGKYAFGGDTLLENIDLTKTGNRIGEGAFYKCLSLKKAELTNVEYVEDFAFADSANLRYVTIPKVIELGQVAFGKYEGTAPSFMNIELPETLKTIGDGAFAGCSGLTEITLPSSVEVYGDLLFALCTNLKTVFLPDNLTKVGEYWFAGCEKLSRINGSENIEEIADYAFRGIGSGLQTTFTVDFPKAKTVGEGAFADSAISGAFEAQNLTKVGIGAFMNTAISSFVAPSLSVIEEMAFQGCSELRSFTFSDKLSYIGILAFQGATKLSSFMGPNNQTTAKLNDYALLHNGVLYTTIGENAYQLQSIPSALNVKTYEVLKGTVRIDFYAGNANTRIEKIVLPDSLRAIGNYAFYGYTTLRTVEFNSVIAPTLESTYVQNEKLQESDVGYELLHNQFDIFGLELCYFNFIDLAGRRRPIKMILPANEDIKGYESIIYEAVFGTVENSARNEYVAMEENMINFIEYAKQVLKLEAYTIGNEKLVNNAITALNGITQNYADYGISEEVWAIYVQTVKTAKAQVARAKLVTASKLVKSIQSEIDGLEDFDIKNLTYLADLTTRIKALKGDDRALLILDRYNEVVEQYDAYRQGLAGEVSPLNTYVAKVGMALASVMASVTTLGAGLYVKKHSL